jgi:hypothetical protein
MPVPIGKNKTSNFRKWQNKAGMLLKTKDRRGKAGGEAGMSQKTKYLALKTGNIVENKGG